MALPQYAYKAIEKSLEQRKNALLSRHGEKYRVKRDRLLSDGSAKSKRLEVTLLEKSNELKEEYKRILNENGFKTNNSPYSRTNVVQLIKDEMKSLYSAQNIYVKLNEKITNSIDTFLLKLSTVELNDDISNLVTEYMREFDNIAKTLEINIE